VIVENKDRLTRVSFDMWKELFRNFNCSLVVVNEPINSENDEKEIFADIISLIHRFSMRMYSARRKNKMMIVEEDLTNEISI
jgi:predicted site-specific integrase-resolvase